MITIFSIMCFVFTKKCKNTIVLVLILLPLYSLYQIWYYCPSMGCPGLRNKTHCWCLIRVRLYYDGPWDTACFSGASFANLCWWATDDLMAGQVHHGSNRLLPPRASPRNLFLFCGSKGVLKSLIMSLDRGIRPTCYYMTTVFKLNNATYASQISCKAQIPLLITK